MAAWRVAAQCPIFQRRKNQGSETSNDLYQDWKGSFLTYSSLPFRHSALHTKKLKGKSFNSRFSILLFSLSLTDYTVQQTPTVYLVCVRTVENAGVLAYHVSFLAKQNLNLEDSSFSNSGISLASKTRSTIFLDITDTSHLTSTLTLWCHSNLIQM